MLASPSHCLQSPWGSASPAVHPPILQSCCPLEVSAHSLEPQAAGRMMRGEPPRCGGCGERLLCPSSGHGRPPASPPQNWGSAPGSPGQLRPAAAAGKRRVVSRDHKGEGCRVQGVLLTCLLSPWWMWQRSCTPFSARFLRRASTAWWFHSQAWAKAAAA